MQSSRQPESLQDLLSYSNDRSFSDSGAADDDQPDAAVIRKQPQPTRANGSPGRIMTALLAGVELADQVCRRSEPDILKREGAHDTKV